MGRMLIKGPKWCQYGINFDRILALPQGYVFLAIYQHMVLHWYRY